MGLFDGKAPNRDADGAELDQYQYGRHDAYMKHGRGSFEYEHADLAAAEAYKVYRDRHDPDR
ncbi:hypothetical protein ACFYVL_16510 [Streptomyces sp. NPDC004111]|uniref:hypothetical protein n=1 Tax=Streptomyces sp. NPDC004111 TaxID=3364690 RepID=UPI0036A3E80B